MNFCLAVWLARFSLRLQKAFCPTAIASGIAELRKELEIIALSSTPNIRAHC
ncbi:MAG: hypothetical protein QNJ72_03100 [Pleurocapsa sp. MO_226.B13]|nr:hypothetical protein [Pleurocapsa sp. MO_226.B13]